METKHTPGPWRTDEFGVVTGGLDFCTSVAETYRSKWKPLWDSAARHKDAQLSDLEAEAEANGRLIAAAPEMLAALENLLTYANRYSDEMAKIGRGAEQLGDLADSESVAGRARRAIALATK